MRQGNQIELQSLPQRNNSPYLLLSIEMQHPLRAFPFPKLLPVTHLLVALHNPELDLVRFDTSKLCV